MAVVGILSFGALLLVGCSANQTKGKAELPSASVKKSLVKAKTSQSEVVQFLGSPNIVTKNAKGYEVWTYTQQTYNPETGDFGGTVILVGGNKAYSSSSSSKFDLILTFDKKDIVEDYAVISSQ